LLQIAEGNEELQIEYRRNWTGQVQRVNCEGLLRVMKNCRWNAEETGQDRYRERIVRDC
jgi:hypothetical protein